MPRSRHYPPQISRFIVSVLYHEAKARNVPMTRLTDQLLRQSLVNSEGWKQVESFKIAESPTGSTAPPSAVYTGGRTFLSAGRAGKPALLSAAVPLCVIMENPDVSVVARRV